MVKSVKLLEKNKNQSELLFLINNNVTLKILYLLGIGLKKSLK